MKKPDKFDRMAHYWFLEWEDGTKPLTEWENNLAAALRRVDRAARQQTWREAAAMVSDYEQPSTTTRRKMLARARKP